MKSSKSSTDKNVTANPVSSGKDNFHHASDSEEKFQSILDDMQEGYFEVDLAGNYTFVNESLCRIQGYPHNELIGMNNRQYTEPEVAQKVYQAFNTVYKTGEPLKEIDWQIIRKDGEKRYIDASVSLRKDDSGRPVGFRGIIRDVTDRLKTERMLRENEERMRGIARHFPGIIYQFYATDSGEYGLNYISDVLPEYSIIPANVDKENLNELYHLFLSRIHEEDREVFLTSIQTAVQTETAWNFEGRVATDSGEMLWIQGISSPTRRGDRLVFDGIILDITKSKRAEELLRKSESQYRLLADHMKDQIWLMGLDLKWKYVSPSVEKLWGYTLRELREIPLEKLLTEESFKKTMDFMSEEMSKALNNPSYILKRLLEIEGYCKNGRTLWIEISFSFIRDENGKPMSILGEGREITQRKRMEDALRESEENFHRSMDDSPLGVRISTLEGKTIYANRAILDMYGYEDIDELEKTPLKERYTPESYEEFVMRKERRLKGMTGPSEYEISIVRKDGAIRHLHVFRKEIFWNGRKQSQVIYQDITLRRRAEERLNATLESLRQSVKTTIQVLGTAAEARDPYTAGHQKRVADIARAIATEMKLSHDKIEAIRMAGAIHDIGKISVPSEILCKPAVLTDLEFSLIKNHAQFSYEIMKDIESPWPLADIVRQHHERMNGSGYPQGLKEKDILIESRILAVADVVEAMVSYRPYRPALELEIALAEIENNAGVLYDSNVTQACLRLFREKRYRIM